MKTILVYFPGGDTSHVAFNQALNLAKRYQSHLEGLFIRQLPPVIAGEGITLPGDYMAQLIEENRAQAEQAKQLFLSMCADNDLPLQRIDETADAPNASWCDIEGTITEGIGEYGRLFDTIVVGRDTSGQNPGDWKHVFETALFDSGRPVLLAADAASNGVIGENILLVWNGGTETARAIAMLLPLLRDAVNVTVLMVEKGCVPGPNADQVCAHLLRNNVSAKAVVIEDGDLSIGRAILDYGEQGGFDLIIKGAYTHSRLRQMIFGGATSEILSSAKLPVLFCH